MTQGTIMTRRFLTTVAFTALIAAGCGASGHPLTKRHATTSTATTEATTTSDPFAPSTDVSGETFPPDTAETTTSTTTTIAPPRIFKVGDKLATNDGITVQIYTYEQPVPAVNQYDTAGVGKEFAVADVEVCAGLSIAASYNDLALTVKMGDNRAYDSGFSQVRTPDLSSGDIPAGGGCRRGWVTFDVPAGQRPVSIIWDYASVHGEWHT